MNLESGYKKIEELLIQAKNNEVHLYISLINLGEIIYILIKKRSVKEARRIVTGVKNLPINIIPLDELLLWKVAKIKAQGGLSYADSFALGTAVFLKAILVTGDPEFKKFEKMVKIEWLLTPIKSGLTKA